MKFFVILCLMGTYLCAEPEIRISLAPPETEFKLSGDISVLSGESKKTKVYQSLNLEAGTKGILINGKDSGVYFLDLKSSGDIEFAKRRFRESLEVKQVEGKLVLIHALPLESYITGVISSEVPASWPLEVLKAQAVAARTYAVWQRDKKEYLESSVMDQVYAGVQREHANAKKAVSETSGKILVYKNRPIHAYFHSNCGGHTADSGEIFGTKVDYLKGVKCPYCKTAPGYNWSYSLSHRELNKKLGVRVSDLDIKHRTDSGRAKTFKINSKPSHKDMHGEHLRRTLGYSNLKSTLITKSSLRWGKASFEGRGYGHGVGMCQWGAYGMAKKNKKHQEILAFYYPGAELRKFY